MAPRNSIASAPCVVASAIDCLRVCFGQAARVGGRRIGQKTLFFFLLASNPPQQETVRIGSSITPSANDTAHLDSLLAPMLVEAAAIMATRAGPSTWLDLFY